MNCLQDGMEDTILIINMEECVIHLNYNFYNEKVKHIYDKIDGHLRFHIITKNDTYKETFNEIGLWLKEQAKTCQS
jgi:hypothetical protein